MITQYGLTVEGLIIHKPKWEYLIIKKRLKIIL